MNERKINLLYEKSTIIAGILLLFLVVLMLTSCGRNQTPQPAPSFIFKGDTVFVDTQSALFTRLSFAVASEQPFARQIEAPAVIAFNPTQLAQVIIPFSGRVTRSHTQLGQSVGAGTPLFEIISADFVEAQKEYFQAKSERELAQTNFQRYQELFNNGVASQRDLDEARNEFELADKEFRNATAIAGIFHSNPARMTVGEPLVIRSPIAGEVIERESVKPLIN